MFCFSVCFDLNLASHVSATGSKAQYMISNALFQSVFFADRLTAALLKNFLLQIATTAWLSCRGTFQILPEHYDTFQIEPKHVLSVMCFCYYLQHLPSMHNVPDLHWSLAVQFCPGF
jgi:hypothetical protein